MKTRAKRKQIIISKEALYAENVANLFLMEIAQRDFDNFNQVAKQSFESWNKEFAAPVLSEDEINMIRGSLRILLQSWNALAPGKTIELLF